MRWVAVVGSVGVHLAIVTTGLAVAAALADDDPAAAAPRAPDAASVAWVDPEAPIEIVLVDAPVAAAAPAPAPRRLTHGDPAGARDELAPTAPAPHATRAPGAGTGAGRGLFTMRGPSLEPPPELLAKLADGGRELPGPVPRSGKLHDAPNGTGVVEDLVTTATVARDGTVSFHDKPNIDAKLHIPALPTPSGIIKDVRDAERALGTWATDPYEQTRYGKMQDLPRHMLGEDPTNSTAQCTHYGDSSCDDPDAPAFEKGSHEAMRGQLGVGGTFDLTAALMKKLHAGDPWAARKQKILRDTFDERVAKGDAFHGDQLAHSAELMRTNLERMWATTPDPAARREALFELWDECADGEGPGADAGARARAMVIGWIRSHVPAGSPGAFSAADSVAFSARKSSHAPFCPYEEVTQSSVVTE